MEQSGRVATLQERLVSQLADAIITAINALAVKFWSTKTIDHEEIGDELAKIYIRLDTILGARSSSSGGPDLVELARGKAHVANFYHPESRNLPVLVVLVKSKDPVHGLSKQAGRFNMDINHVLNHVMVAEIKSQTLLGNAREGHLRSKKATVALWLRKKDSEKAIGSNFGGSCTSEANEVTFRDENGVACDGAMALAVGDLLPSGVLSRLESALPHDMITVPFSSLTSFIDIAEREAVLEPLSQQATTLGKSSKGEKKP